MKEDFLHYVWKFQKFDARVLSTVAGEPVTILSTGQHNLNSGPDFFNSQVAINNQLWAGNVEIHIKSSDWYLHNHEKDTNYDSVILHVVWVHDSDIFRKDNSVIPTLVLKPLVDLNLLTNYKNLLFKEDTWINCENSFSDVEPFLFNNWLDRLYFERLEQKSQLLFKELEKSKNNWEEVLFKMLCKNFGLKVNGDSFLSLAQSVDFSTVKKCSQNQFELESLFFGQMGLLEDTIEDAYYKSFQNKYKFLKSKFSLNTTPVLPVKFFRLRPPNFPTIRLSQLSVLYAEKQGLFSEIIAAFTIEELYKIFDISASAYWDSHYNFGVSSLKRRKKLTKIFIDLLIINTVIPIKFCYSKFIDKDCSEELIALATAIPNEKNNIIKKFNELNPIFKNACNSQALLQLKTYYCDKNRCLKCVIGNCIIEQ
jgi:hypothetical protein